MLKERLVSAILIISAVVLLLFIDWVVGLVIVLLTIAGLYEFFTMVEKKGISIYKYFGIIIGAIIPLSVAYRFELTRNWEFFFIVLALLFLIIMQLRRRENTGTVVGISVTMFGIMYISWFLSFIIKIRYLENGFGLVITLLLITKLGDIGAYLIGTRFGKRLLIPRISPKKSVEGSIGGLIFSILGAFVCRPFLPLTYLYLAFIGLFLGVLGQLGDLSESLMKRDCQIKDSGNLFPGMGGVLDVIDSLLFTAPVFYFYMIIIPK